MDHPLERKVATDIVDFEEDEHEYEALPSGYGWGVNMAAGAMVSVRDLAFLCSVLRNVR